MGFPSKAGMDEFESGYLVIATYNLKDFFKGAEWKNILSI